MKKVWKYLAESHTFFLSKRVYLLHPTLKLSVPSPTPNLILSSSFTTKVTVPGPSYTNVVVSIMFIGLTSGEGYGSGLGGLFRYVTVIT
jgi:hypothetical protein